MSIRPSPEAEAQGALFRLLPARPRPRPGETLGSGAGDSVEFEDRRGFEPGDEVRRIDWRAFARTDRLLLKRYRAEHQPALTVILDTSRSMALHPEKAQRAVDLARVALLSSPGWSQRLWADGRPLDPAALGQGLTFDHVVPWIEHLDAAVETVQPGAVCLVISDLLFPAAPEPWVRRLSARAGRVVVLQVLAQDELSPTPLGAARLEDVESGAAVELVVDEVAVAAYRRRREALSAAIETATRQVGGGFALCQASAPLAEDLARRAVSAGLLGPR